MTKLAFTERDDSVITETNWESRFVNRDDPPWEVVRDAIARLDNGYFTEVSMRAGEGRDLVAMSIGGGRDDRVVCYVARPDHPDWDQVFHYTVDRAHVTAKPSFVQKIGGQGTALPAFLSVPRDVAMRAAKYFLTHREEDPSLAWERI